MDENVVQISDDDTVRIGNGLTTSGRVLRLIAEDMFGWSVDQYIADAQSGRAQRRRTPAFVPTMAVTPELIDEITERVTERSANSMSTAIDRRRWEFERTALGGD